MHPGDRVAFKDDEVRADSIEEPAISFAPNFRRVAKRVSERTFLATENTELFEKSLLILCGLCGFTHSIRHSNFRSGWQKAHLVIAQSETREYTLFGRSIMNSKSLGWKLTAGCRSFVFFYQIYDILDGGTLAASQGCSTNEHF